MFCQKLNLFGCLPIWQSISMTVARFNYSPRLLNPSFLKIMYIAILENLILHLARFFFSSWMLVENQCQKNALVSYLCMHCIKKVRIRGYSVQMWKNVGKMRTRITLNTNAFYAVMESMYIPFRRSFLTGKKYFSVIWISFFFKWRRAFWYRSLMVTLFIRTYVIRTTRLKLIKSTDKLRTFWGWEVEKNQNNNDLYFL